jgi:hypothetical protein
MKANMIVRILGAIALMYFVYQETGWATTICLSFITLQVELSEYINKLRRNRE